MSYSEIFFYSFKNRHNDTFTVSILKDGFVGVSTELQGTGVPFTVAPLAGDGDIYSPVKPISVTLEFWSKNSGNEGDGIPAYEVSINDFYSDAQNAFKYEFYEELNGTLLYTGFLQIDNGSQDLQDTAQVITIQGNDNLGLLQNILLDAAFTALSLGDYGFFPLTTFLSAILQQTTLQLNCDAYLNIFENSTDDRSILDTNDFLQQTVIHTNYFLNSDGTFQDCYTVLTAICHDFGMTLFQANGKWNLIREAEYRLFTDGQVPGTRYDYQFNVLQAIITTPSPTIGRNPANTLLFDIEPINANQQRRILRPYISTKRTLTYQFPQWIDNQTFINLGGPFNFFVGPGAVFYPGFTYAGVTYTGYNVTSDWYLETTYIACLVTALDTGLGSIIDTFLDILTLPGLTYKWLQFNPIPVVANAGLSFSFDFFTFWTNHTGPVTAPTHGAFPCTCRIQLLTNAGTIYNLQQTTVGSAKFLTWGTPVASSTWDSFVGLTVTGDENFANNNSWNLSSFDDNGVIPVMPSDGLLLIGLAGANGPSVYFYDCGIKNISLDIANNLGAISSTVAQVHTQTQPEVVKNISDETINLDDTIVNTISGTLLTTALTTYGIWVGDAYTTKTSLWHRANLTEDLRLNQINTYDTLFIQRIARTIVEGDFFGLLFTPGGVITGNGNIDIDPPEIEISGRANADGINPGMYISFGIYTYLIVSVAYSFGTVQIVTDPSPVGSSFPSVDYTIFYADEYVSLLNLLKIDFLPGKNFIQGIATYDFMSAIWSVTMYELYDDTEVDGDLSNTYAFNYLFSTK